MFFSTKQIELQKQNALYNQIWPSKVQTSPKTKEDGFIKYLK